MGARARSPHQCRCEECSLEASQTGRAQRAEEAPRLVWRGAGGARALHYCCESTHRALARRDGCLTLSAIQISVRVLDHESRRTCSDGCMVCTGRAPRARAIHWRSSMTIDPLEYPAGSVLLCPTSCLPPRQNRVFHSMRNCMLSDLPFARIYNHGFLGRCSLIVVVL